MPFTLSLVILATAASSGAFAQDSSANAMWMPTYQDAYKALQSGDYQSGEKLMIKAAEMAQTFSSGDARYWQSLEGLAVAQTNAKHYSEAEKTFSKLLVLKSKTYAENSPEIATTRANLANLYFYENQYKQADALYRAALTNLTADSAMALEASLNFGMTLTAEGKFDEASALLNSVCEKFKTTNGPQSVQMVYARLALSGNFVERGDYKVALAQMTALLNDPNGLNNSSVDPHLIASCMSQIAECNSRLGRYADAESFDRRRLRSWLATPGAALYRDAKI